jgi:hypothetical protein
LNILLAVDEESKVPNSFDAQNTKLETKMTPVHQVPNTMGGVLLLTSPAIAGATTHGVALTITHNDAPKITAKYYDLVGQPGAGLSAGKQGQLNQKRIAVTEAESFRREKIAAGLVFCANAVDHLKEALGRTWNPRWQAAGFTRGSLAIPKNPLGLLFDLRAYFLANAAQELPAKDLTAADADALITAIENAERDLNLARSARKSAAEARDESFRILRRSLVGLRSELDQILSDDDPRWLDFGFSRPVDRRAPQAVAGLTLRPGGVAGEIIVEWEPSVGAANYRVSRQVLTVDDEPVEVGLFTDRMVIINGLSSGKTVRVSVTARNEAGETLPASSIITIA